MSIFIHCRGAAGHITENWPQRIWGIFREFGVELPRCVPQNHRQRAC